MRFRLFKGLKRHLMVGTEVQLRDNSSKVIKVTGVTEDRSAVNEDPSRVFQVLTSGSVNYWIRFSATLGNSGCVVSSSAAGKKD